MKHACIALSFFFLFVLNATHAFAQQSGAWQTELYFGLLKNKRVAVVANPTSMVGKSHLVDTLLASGIQLKKIFAPEHGFRGDVPAGEKVNSSVDEKTGIPIVSLYGKHYQPTAEDLQDVDDYFL